MSTPEDRPALQPEGSARATLPALFISFAKIGVLTFGGGVAMLPMLQKEIAEKRNWATEEELLDYFAIGQCTPGIIAVNTATFVGCRKRGTLGGIIATLGVVFPSLVIITLIAGLISNFANLPAVKSAFAGIRVCVCVLIANAALKVIRKSTVDLPAWIIFLSVTVLSYFLDLSPAVFVVISGLSGVLIRVLKQRKAGGKQNE